MIKKLSYFKDENLRDTFFEKWTKAVSGVSGSVYRRINIFTSLGSTVVWAIDNNKADAQTLVVFPGFRTSALFWDLDTVLEPLKETCRIFLVETNGQPNLSDGTSPDIRSDDYGQWAAEVLEKLSITKAHIAGASFGGLVCLKLCLVNPSVVDKVFLLNPGCLQPFSMKPCNLCYNLLPIIFPTRENIATFLDKAVLGDNHRLTDRSRSLLIDFEEFALKQYVDRTEKPYTMRPEELKRVHSPVYLLVGDGDILFPFRKSVRYARQHLSSLQATHVLPDTGHGIETSRQAMEIVQDIITGS
jgi:pimeloyl-ACP methyl ester carboxylesterase